MALTAVDREIRWDAFLNDRSNEPAISKLFQSTKLTDSQELDDSPGRAPAIVEVKATDGQIFHKRVDIAKGLAGNPFTRDELQQKFIRLATNVVSEARAIEIINTTQRLENLTDIREIIELMHE